MGAKWKKKSECGKVMKLLNLYQDKEFGHVQIETFAVDKINMAKMTISPFKTVHNPAGKGENADYQHFLLFPQGFPKPSFLVSLKVGIVW